MTSIGHASRVSDKSFRCANPPTSPAAIFARDHLATPKISPVFKYDDSHDGITHSHVNAKITGVSCKAEKLCFPVFGARVQLKCNLHGAADRLANWGDQRVLISAGCKWKRGLESNRVNGASPQTAPWRYVS